MQSHKVGQVCLNGHKITGDAQSEFAQKFCGKCGEATITTCQACSGSIRGYHIEFGLGFSAAAFCKDCGGPYPWTQRKIQAAKELVDEIDGLDAVTAEKAKDSFSLIVSDTPSTQVGAVRIMKMLTKAGPTIGGAIKEILVGIGTEAAKKAMGL